MSPVPMVLPITTDAAEAAPTAMDLTIRKMVEATLFAAMAEESMWPRITVCRAVLIPHSPCTNSMGRVSLK